MIAGAVVCLVLALDPMDGGEPRASHSPASRVRALSASARVLLADAVARSATVGSLIRELERERVFVFIDTRIDPEIPTAQTALLAANSTGRYIHVLLNPALTLDRRIELLGHELHHALEIARADDVTDAASFRRHYGAVGRELGRSNAVARAYETDAAHDIELQVRRELTRRGGATAPR